MKHGGKFVSSHLIVVEYPVVLQLTQGCVDVRRSADGREYLVQHTAHLDVAGCFLLVVIARDEVATLVALLEFRLGGEGLDSDGLRSDRGEERIGGNCWSSDGSSGCGNGGGGAVGEEKRGLLVLLTAESAIV